MAQKVEDFNLPASAISKIVRETVPQGVDVTDGARMALNKAASVFVLYVTSSANSLSQDSNRKRLLAKDVFESLEDLDFDLLIPPLQSSFKAYQKGLDTKKQAKENKRASTSKKDEEDDEEVADEDSDIKIIEEDEEGDVIVLGSDSESENEVNNESEASH